MLGLEYFKNSGSLDGLPASFSVRQTDDFYDKWILY